MKVTQSIESSGFGISGDIGGIPRKTYYTPDGRVIKAIANDREFVIKDKEGKVIRSGKRDANLDKGWLLYMPPVLKPYCKGCDRWHDTPAEVASCIKKQNAYLNRMEIQARKELKKQDQEKDIKIESLSKELNELKEMVQKFVGAKNG